MERRACVGVAAHEFVAISRERKRDREMFWRAYAYIGIVRVWPERGRGRGSQLRVWILDETRTSLETWPKRRIAAFLEVDTEPILLFYSLIFAYLFDPFPVARAIARDPKN